MPRLTSGGRTWACSGTFGDSLSPSLLSLLSMTAGGSLKYQVVESGKHGVPVERQAGDRSRTQARPPIHVAKMETAGKRQK